MKKFFLLILLFNTAAILSDEGDASRIITPNFYNGVIHSSDLNQSAASSSAMFTIKSSGRYYIANDIIMKSGGNNTVTAIKIDADNVLLDMNLATIYLGASNTATDLIGIEVSDSKSNITIRNGTIRGINDTGIKVGSANNVLIEDVKVSNCTSSTSEVTGLLLSSSNNVTVQSCEFNDGNFTGSNTVNGVSMTGCTSCLFKDCVANGNVSSDQNSYGFKMASSCKYNRFVNCSAINNSSGSNNAAADKAVGFFADSGQGNIFENCIAVGNTGGSDAANIAVGFYLAGSEKYSTIRGCRAEANDGGSGGEGYGILVASGATYCAVMDNKIIANDGNGGGGGVGISDENALSTLIYVRNFAYANNATTGPAAVNYAVTYLGTFPVLTADYGDYANISSAGSDYRNIEIDESP